jgi:hypothetical protein
MKRLNKSLRRKRQTKQRSRKHHARRHTRRNRQRGGSLPVPAGALVGMSTGGEYGVPILITRERAEAELERGGLEE